MRIFQEQSTKVLKKFLVRPFVDEFSDVADLIWKFLPQSDYNSLLKEMYKGRIKKTDFYFQKLFQEHFEHIPYVFRKSFVDRECEAGSYFDKVLKMHYKKAIVVTFRSVDAAASVGLVSSEFTFEDFQHFISRDRYDVVEVCFRVARLSIEEREYCFEEA
ncbi:hypothetical protein AVEN_85597-1 [Araneus ventricosus]|uniref:Uncharacterized protein n=1 Tax=Araneus ventricosus TaxID=182803 RepID=A0A4Y2LG48_ARAVE|nr:hypothetical protein AVEN_85597-1 [Araneus ventricosus]